MKHTLLAIGIIFFSYAFLTPAQASEIITEQITYAVNEDYVQGNPNWQAGALEVIEHVNSVLALNTNKRYEIVQFKTYNLTDYNSLGSDPEYHHDNGYGGTTIFHWVNLPENSIKPVPSFTLLVNVSSYSFIDNVRYQQVYLVDEPAHSILLGSAQPTFENNLQLILHELGHTMGLSVPDWYFYDFQDVSGVTPRLDDFSLRRTYPNDPMSSWGVSDYQYTDFNAEIINNNLRHEKSYTDIQYIASSKVRITVTNQDGAPVSGATVQIFGGKKGCFYCGEVTQNPLLRTTTTSSSGQVVIDAPSVNWELSESSITEYIGLIVKVEKDGVRAGSYVIGQQMQQNKFLDGTDEYQLSMVLEMEPLSTKTTPVPSTPTEQTSTNTVQREKTAFTQTDTSLVSNVLGKILLQVEEAGEAWYVDPITSLKYYLQNGTRAYVALRLFGLGITNQDLQKIPVGVEDRFTDLDTDGDGLADRLEEGLGTDVYRADTDGDGYLDGNEVRNGYNPLGPGTVSVDESLAQRLKGRILLQVEEVGQAWYVSPDDGKRYYMKNGDAAYQIMRFLSTGVTNQDLRKIPVGDL